MLAGFLVLGITACAAATQRAALLNRAKGNLAEVFEEIRRNHRQTKTLKSFPRPIPVTIFCPGNAGHSTGGKRDANGTLGLRNQNPDSECCLWGFFARN